MNMAESERIEVNYPKEESEEDQNDNESVGDMEMISMSEEINHLAPESNMTGRGTFQLSVSMVEDNSSELDKLAGLDDRDKLKLIFDMVDTNHNDNISRKEFKKLVKKLKEHGIQVSHHQEMKMFNQADKNYDGTLQFDEFVSLMLNPENDEIFAKFKARLKLNKLQYYANKFVGLPEREVEYREEFSCNPPPLIIMFFTLLQLSFFFVDDKIKNTLAYDPEKKEQVWRFITYMLVHTGTAHLVSNLVFQILFGIPLEMVHKWRVAIVYLAGVLWGCLAFSCFDSEYLLVGASGGVYSLITAQFAIIFLNWSEIGHPFIKSAILAIFVIIDLCVSIFDESNLISHVAHMGGAFAGILVGTKVLRNLVVKRYEVIIQWICIGIFFLLTTVAIIYNIVVEVQK